jgi:predicted nucleic acid-binding protein
LILLDTNVLSALMQASPPANVVGWLDRQAPEDIWTTTITVFEVRFGLALLTNGRRRRAMEAAFQALLDEDLAGRVAVFDQSAADAAALLAATRRLSGRTVEFRDTQIAGIALARRASIATRNIRHFQDFAATVIDPWTDG